MLEQLQHPAEGRHRPGGVEPAGQEQPGLGDHLTRRQVLAVDAAPEELPQQITAGCLGPLHHQLAEVPEQLGTRGRGARLGILAVGEIRDPSW